jgi:hypothetical protein
MLDSRAQDVLDNGIQQQRELRQPRIDDHRNMIIGCKRLSQGRKATRQLHGGAGGLDYI